MIDQRDIAMMDAFIGGVKLMAEDLHATQEREKQANAKVVELQREVDELVKVRDTMLANQVAVNHAYEKLVGEREALMQENANLAKDRDRLNGILMAMQGENRQPSSNFAYTREYVNRARAYANEGDARFQHSIVVALDSLVASLERGAK